MVIGKHAGQGVGRMSRDTRALPQCEVTTPDHSTFQVHSSGKDQVGICRSSGEGLNTGCQEKAPVRCPCSRLAALHGVPQTRWRCNCVSQSPVTCPVVPFQIGAQMLKNT